MLGGASLPHHPFVKVVLQYFIVALFQFTLNSFCIIVAFFIAFTKACLIEPVVNNFSYIFEIKALAKHEGFWYTTRWGLDVKGIVGLHSNIGQWKDEFFFYPSVHSREFKTACKWQQTSSIWLLPYFSNSFFFTDLYPRPVLEEEEAIHLDIFNALSEGKKGLQDLGYHRQTL